MLSREGSNDNPGEPAIASCFSSRAGASRVAEERQSARPALRIKVAVSDVAS